VDNGEYSAGADRTRQDAQRAHRSGPGISHRPAFAAGRTSRPARPVAGQDPFLLRHARPHLGAGRRSSSPPVAATWTWASSFLSAIEPFRLSQYLSFAEINADQGDQADGSSRKTGRRATPSGVKTATAAYRDIRVHHPVFAAAQRPPTCPAVGQRTRSLAASSASRGRLLTTRKPKFLDRNYRFLRKVEHRLQLLSILQTHRCPIIPMRCEKLARRMGYA